MVGTRSLSPGAHSHDPLALPTLRSNDKLDGRDRSPPNLEGLAADLVQTPGISRKTHSTHGACLPRKEGMKGSMATRNMRCDSLLHIFHTTESCRYPRSLHLVGWPLPSAR